MDCTIGQGPTREKVPFRIVLFKENKLDDQGWFDVGHFLYGEERATK
jgi:hypothetical protein